MADLAVGISKAAVEALVSKVQSAIKEDAEKWLTVQRDLVFITGEFEMMQSFLDTASEEHVKNKIVGTWVRQVRDLSNDVEDSIDFILHIDTTKRSCGYGCCRPVGARRERYCRWTKQWPRQRCSGPGWWT